MHEAHEPEHPASDLANAGMYMGGQELFGYLNEDKPLLDFGRDVLPKLIKRMYGWPAQGYLIDINTLKNYQRANREWKHESIPGS